MKQLLILSGKGGTGKTTIASAFIRLGDIKAYADCDVDVPNLHLVMDQPSSPRLSDFYGLDKAEIYAPLCIKCDLCRQRCRFDAIDIDNRGEYVVDSYACEGCGVCEVICPSCAITMKPAIAGKLMLYKNKTIFSTAQLRLGSGNSGLLVTDVKKQLKSAVGNVDLAIIDGSPGIGCPVIASLSGVDMVLIVAEPSLSGINDMERIIETARGFQIKIAVCINKYDTNISIAEEIKKFCHEEGFPFVGKIPFDRKAIKAINKGQSIVDIDCAAGRATKAIFDRTMKILLDEMEEMR
ncbi:MAG TPA: ATPase [Tepidimicrobium sp.]|nr:ATPase [Tepidimicrobium sp.]